MNLQNRLIDSQRGRMNGSKIGRIDGKKEKKD